MKLKVFAVAILASMACFAAPSGEIVFSGPAVAGTAQLAAGHYKVELNGTTVTFTPIDVTPAQSSPSKAGKVTTEAKVENGDKKFDSTIAENTKEGNVTHVHSIQLESTKIRLIFN